MIKCDIQIVMLSFVISYSNVQNACTPACVLKVNVSK